MAGEARSVRQPPECDVTDERHPALENRERAAEDNEVQNNVGNGNDECPEGDKRVVDQPEERL